MLVFHLSILITLHFKAMAKIRKQLTLFLDEIEASPIEVIRSKYNPAQYLLIKSHITLAREDELAAWDAVLRKLNRLQQKSFKLTLAPPERFWEGKGVFIPILDDEQNFRKLRHTLLAPEGSLPRDHEAHITLMHPRNSTCTDAIFEEIKAVTLPEKLKISRVSLIEQVIGEKWKVLDEFSLI